MNNYAGKILDGCDGKWLVDDAWFIRLVDGCIVVVEPAR